MLFICPQVLVVEKFSLLLLLNSKRHKNAHYESKTRQIRSRLIRVEIQVIDRFKAKFLLVL